MTRSHPPLLSLKGNPGLRIPPTLNIDSPKMALGLNIKTSLIEGEKQKLNNISHPGIRLIKLNRRMTGHMALDDAFRFLCSNHTCCLQHTTIQYLYLRKYDICTDTDMGN